MSFRKQIIGIVLTGLLSFALLVTVLCFVSSPVEGGLFRPGFPTVEDVKDAVKDDEYEKLEDKTSFVKDYIKVLFNNLF